MQPDTFVMDYVRYLSFLSGIVTVIMIFLWIIFGKIMPASVQKAIQEEPAKRDYFQNGTRDFLDNAKKAKLFAFLFGLFFLMCLYIRFRYR
jgi:hypothetical protein